MLLKRRIVKIVSFLIVFAFSFSINPTNAENKTKDIEIDLNYRCMTGVGGLLPEAFPTTVKATIPKSVAPGGNIILENLVININIPRDLFPEKSIAESPNFTIQSINEDNDIITFISNFEKEFPPLGEPFSLTFPSNGGENIGPFIAGQEGKVILKASEIQMNIIGYIGDIALPMALKCSTYEVLMGEKEIEDEEELIIATIPIDGEAPVITLNGNNPMIVKQGDPYNEPGATANDNFDGDVSDDIEISGDVDTSTIGTYTVTYTVSDSVGNVATVERTVNVVEPFGDWYTGEGPPNDSLGNNGDSYLDLTTGDVYKRDPNTWTKVGNLKGDDGKRGNVILTGSGAPSADAGDVGDLYLDTKSGDLYEKTADGWEKIANLQGPAGPPGPQGPKGAAGTSGGSGSGDDGGGKGSTKTSTSSDKDGKGKSAQGGKLPKTATSLPTLVLIGALLTAIGGVLFLRRRKAMK